jgi:hypothetical protein
MQTGRDTPDLMKPLPWDDVMGTWAEERVLNPWFSIWFEPRATIRQLVQTDDEHFVLVLAGLGGVSLSLILAILGIVELSNWEEIFMFAGVAGPIIGCIGLYIHGWLACWTGRWIGGSGSTEQIRCALAWSNVPSLGLIPAWLAWLAWFGGNGFTSDAPDLDPSPIPVLPAMVLILLAIIGLAWELIIFLKGLAEVQGFSAWRALGNYVLASMAFGIIANAIEVLFVLATRAPGLS